jgi:malonyl-CoA O-methyltransferase
MPPAFTLQRNSIRRQFARRVKRIAAADFLLREVERRMFERLDLIKIAPQRLLDVGCGLGHGLVELQRRYPQALALGLDSALPMLQAQQRSIHDGKRLHRLRSGLGQILGRALGQSRPPPLTFAADAGKLSLAPASIDLLWSNLCWHWLVDPVACLADWYRVIKPGGLVMFSSFGVDTFKELAQLGWPLPLFPDMHDIGDALSQTGFADPVMDTERLTLSYQDIEKLIGELSALGGNPRSDRRTGLTGRAASQRWRQTLQAAQNQLGGTLLVTVELIHGHAWCPTPKRLPRGLAPVNWVPKDRLTSRPERG